MFKIHFEIGCLFIKEKLYEKRENYFLLAKNSIENLNS
jgi:hypothetical protein